LTVNYFGVLQAPRLSACGTSETWWYRPAKSGVEGLTDKKTLSFPVRARNVCACGLQNQLSANRKSGR